MKKKFDLAWVMGNWGSYELMIVPIGAARNTRISSKPRLCKHK